MLLHPKRNQSSVRGSIHWGLLFLEVVMIVFGVLMGLGANRLRDASLNKQEAEKALRYIAEEIQHNRNQVESNVEYHRQVTDSLRGMLRRLEQFEEGFTMNTWRQAVPQGFKVPLLQTTGWELANITGTIAHMDFAIAADLSRLYRAQDFCQQKLNKLGDNLYLAENVSPDRIQGLLIALSLLMNDIVIQEDRLMNRYSEILTRLE